LRIGMSTRHCVSLAPSRPRESTDLASAEIAGDDLQPPSERADEDQVVIGNAQAEVKAGRNHSRFLLRLRLHRHDRRDGRHRSAGSARSARSGRPRHSPVRRDLKAASLRPFLYGRGVSAVSWENTDYEVTFNRDITACAPVGTTTGTKGNNSALQTHSSDSWMACEEAVVDRGLEDCSRWPSPIDPTLSACLTGCCFRGGGPSI
jgi:hypothetical protein